MKLWSSIDICSKLHFEIVGGRFELVEVKNTEYLRTAPLRSFEMFAKCKWFRF